MPVVAFWRLELPTWKLKSIAQCRSPFLVSGMVWLLCEEPEWLRTVKQEIPGSPSIVASGSSTKIETKEREGAQEDRGVPQGNV